MNGVPVLSTVDISVRYGPSRPAVDGVSLSFTEGSFSVLLGPSGAGKSSLLRALNGLVKPTDGQVLVGNTPLVFAGAALRAHRRRMAMIFQQHQFVGRVSALANTLTGRLGYYSSWRSLLPLPADEKRFAMDCLDRVGLGEFVLKRADQLSGGQQQRVGIARALAQRPDFLIADEPVASLDPATAHRVLTLLRTVCKQDGITALVSLHQVELARKFADRVIGMREGRIVFDGAPQQLDAAALDQIYDRQGSPDDPELESAVEDDSSWNPIPLTA